MEFPFHTQKNLVGFDKLTIISESFARERAALLAECKNERNFHSIRYWNFLSLSKV